MRVVDNRIELEELKTIAKLKFGNLVKAVVDVDLEIMVIDAELHSDEEAVLLGQGSNQNSLWGINLYPDIEGSDWIEFDSMINLRPSVGNMTRGVNKQEIKDKIVIIVNKLIKR